MQISLFDTLGPERMPAEMTRPEQSVYQILTQHRGRDTAISLPSMATLCHLDPREVQEIVSRLVIAYHIPVGSTSNASRPGYYLITDHKEAQAVYKSLKGRALAILKRASVIGKIDKKQLLQEITTELEFEADRRRRRSS